jgi:glycosyltransferase involved in cell wall biosynthesis
MNFSVIIPLFNKSQFIERTICSVINQTYKNYEIIVVDDGSTDGGDKIVNSIGNKKIKYIYQENAGVSSARNNGAKLAKNEFIVFLDADDTWESEFLLELAVLIKKYPFAKLFGLNQKFKYLNGFEFYLDYSYKFSGADYGIIENYFETFIENGRSPFSNSSCCFEKKAFLFEGGYKEGVKLTEDSDLWCRFALKYQIAFCNKLLSTYFIETPNNTRTLMQKNSYCVTNTLERALINNLVPERKINSVKKLIGFFELSLTKRAILLNHKFFALKKIFNLKIISHYPFQFIFILLILAIPFKIMSITREKIIKRRK